MELSSFLKELGCPYHRLLDGPVSGRYRSEADSTLLVDFLTGECMTGVITQQIRNEEKKHQISLSQVLWGWISIGIIYDKTLGVIFQTLDTPSNTMKQLFQTLLPDVNCNGTETTITEAFDQMAKQLDSTTHPIPELLFRPSANLSNDQWMQLSQCHSDLQEEYNLRRKLMITRLDVTMLGFQWKADTKLDVGQIWRQRKRYLSTLEASLNQTDIADLLVADQNLLTVERIVSTRIQGRRKNVFQGNLIVSICKEKCDYNFPIYPFIRLMLYIGVIFYAVWFCLFLEFWFNETLSRPQPQKNQRQIRWHLKSCGIEMHQVNDKIHPRKKWPRYMYIFLNISTLFRFSCHIAEVSLASIRNHTCRHGHREKKASLVKICVESNRKRLNPTPATTNRERGKNPRKNIARTVVI